MKYRPKGEAKDDEAPEQAEEGAAQDKKDKKEKKDKKDEKEKEKNTVYMNPLDFKEKKKYKSKWEEYRYGAWRKGRPGPGYEPIPADPSHKRGI